MQVEGANIYIVWYIPRRKMGEKGVGGSKRERERMKRGNGSRETIVYVIKR